MSRLYLDHFGLRSAPFDLTPNPDFFFAGGKRGELLEAITFAALDAPGIVLVIGEVGNGKTMLCRMLAQRIQQLGNDLIYLDNPSFGPREILHTVAHDWGLDIDSDKPLQWQLQQHLLARHRQARRVVLLIDEAQAMPAASLEEIRLLSNLESPTDKLLRIVLFGQPELADKLRNPALRQLCDRIVHRFDIDPLSVTEAQRYLYHRLQCAGSRGHSIMSEAAARRIARASRGRLRSLHHLAERALLAAYAQGRTIVEPDQVRKAEQDLNRTGIDFRPGPRFWSKTGPGARSLVIALGGAMLGAALAWWVNKPLELSARDPSARAEPASHTPKPEALGEQQALAAPTKQNAQQTDTVSAADSKPVSPPPAQTSSPLSGNQAVAASWQEWLRRGQRILNDPQFDGYTIQLLLGPNADAIGRQLASEPTLAEHAWVLSRYYPLSNPQPVWALFWGHFRSRQESAAKLSEFPPAWQRLRPQIRSLSALRSEAQPDVKKSGYPDLAVFEGLQPPGFQ